MALYRYARLSPRAAEPEVDIELTVAQLREDVHRTLQDLMRLIRTTDGRFLSLHVDDISNLHLINETECDYAFLWAAYLGRLDFLRYFHEQRGADLNVVHPRERYNALHLAALSGSVECVHWLLSKGCRMQRTIGGLTLLHFAANGHALPICRYFVESGYEIDATALHAAVYSGSAECVRFLLGTGGNVNEYDDSGRCALHIAADLGNTEILRVLLSDDRLKVNAKRRSDRLSALHFASENGYPDCMKMLLEHGADVNAVCARGRTSLHLTCKLSYADCVQLLLDHGANVDLQDNEGRTALHRAINKCPWSMDIVSMLVEQGKANTSIGDNFGYTALHIAALEELEQCVNYLIQNGGNVTASTKGNFDATHVFASFFRNSQLSEAVSFAVGLGLHSMSEKFPN